MNIKFPVETYKTIQKAKAKSPVFHEKDTYRVVSVESRLILREDYPLIREVVKRPEFSKFLENRRIERALRTLETVEASDGKSVRITSLPMLSEMLRKALGKDKLKYVFQQYDCYDTPLPYFVSAILYTETSQYHTAHVEVQLKAVHRGGKDDKSMGSASETFLRADLAGGSLEKILERKGLFLSTAELLEEYKEDLTKYREISPRTGEQYLARGGASKDGDGRWSKDVTQMLREGDPVKVVIDDLETIGSATDQHATSFWGKAGGDPEEEEGEEAEEFTIPTHPVVRIFDLWRQEFFTIHVSSLERYQYDTKLVERIVLPENHQRLVEALTAGSARRLEDVVQGKASGVIILCTGKPGTGKTLTAEVYSEYTKRPLYTVQCAQLGTDPDKLEKNLSEVLEQAIRWKVILLIDEADVYIHERGKDVNQNAIVGVFLRLLEYYKGILFMNTNREEVIDDAILSRATAHIRYLNPAPNEARRIWKILMAQYRVKEDPKLLDSCLKAWGEVSGRTVRQIIRLGKLMAEYDGRDQPKFEDFQFAANYQEPSE
jgi:hypothetical protein